jgi:hypothetical protein
MNTKKILAIFMCMLVIALIPVAAGATTEQNNGPQTSAMGSTTIRGLITKPQLENGGHYVSFRCIWVHYSTRGIGQTQSGFLHMFQKLVLKNNFQGYLGDHMIMAHFPGLLEF